MTVKAAQSNFFKYRMVLERNGVLLGGGGGGDLSAILILDSLDLLALP